MDSQSELAGPGPGCSEERRAPGVPDALTSRDSALTEVALRVLQEERAKLSLQPEKVNEIAECDKNINTIQNGGEDALAVKLDCLLKAASQRSGRLPSRFKQNAQGQFVCEAKPEDPCQELVMICDNSNWAHPSYTTSACDGGFITTATLDCPDFYLEISVRGTVQPEPEMAKASAAMSLFGKVDGDSLFYNMEEDDDEV